MPAVEQIGPESRAVDPPLARHRIEVGAVARVRAAAYLRNITDAEPCEGRFPAVCIHYQQTTTAHRFGVTHATIERVCHTILARGDVPIILDWQEKSPLPDHRTILSAGVYDGDLWAGAAPGDSEMLAALIGQCVLMIGVDGAPLQIAGATDTPTIGVWIDSHPRLSYGVCPKVLHVLPEDHARWLSDVSNQQHFYERYAHRTYRDLEEELPGIVAEHLAAGSRHEAIFGLTTSRFDESYYEEHKAAGLDYLVYIDWQRNYGAWLTGVLNWHGRRVLDIGCACGAMVRGFREAGADMQGVDVNGVEKVSDTFFPPKATVL